MNYEEYLNYLDILKGVARIPYTVSVEDPPGTMFGIRRPYTEKEWNSRLEFEKEQSQKASEMGMIFSGGL